ncbi:Protein kti12 [Taphrina deformans PYCC 5710]|uniref:Protein kti12 n=1 Tax=Taphrina deformans (strain PYCC 5710 / ATCC 11124 / CBS 356.35 / IMI 108563 / JCM 9778 / NBRC 8474) TaxID=1097556 RepID=R4XBN2_TAPDE|nr:Protein kti12 [Taphrina deformans PYCC 5710]|eukprot:CCG82990.1 Protein kti12 [Taphrina deformans PYCC 5710]
MPLLIMTGFPSSGKSHWARKIHDEFQERIRTSTDARISKMTCVVINDESLGVDKMDYSEARREKAARGLLFSAVERYLGKECIVLCDGLNYIKGFRYQLSCSAKAVGTPHCLVHVGCPVDQCTKFNTAREAHSEAYTKQVFEELIMRYEEPNTSSRWDSPCFNIFWEDQSAATEDIWNALVNRKIARPNASTLMKPAVEGDYMYELDRVTQSVIASIMDTQKMGMVGGTIKVDGLTLTLPDQAVGVAALQRLKRQFINLNKNLMVGGPARLKTLFVEFLNDQWN